MHSACEGAGLKPLIGCRLDLDGCAEPARLSESTATAMAGCRGLLSLGKMRAEKGECDLSLADVAEHSEGIAFIAWPTGRSR